jgi:hypothetical protein
MVHSSVKEARGSGTSLPHTSNRESAMSNEPKDPIGEVADLVEESATAAVDQAEETVDVAGQQAETTASQAEGAVEQAQDEARKVAKRRLLREAPYAALGLGNVVVETARGVEASSLPERVKRTPPAVVSEVSHLGETPKASYLALAAKGRGAPLPPDVAADAAAPAEAAGQQAKGAAGAAREGVKGTAEQSSSAARSAGGRAKGLIGKARGAVPAAGQADDDAGSETEEELDTGTGRLEDRTVAQLRNRATELGIEGRSGLRKQELIDAIRDAT